tara:strand:- start:71 stop:919 length:849 start_codon:yes stop_codon:yes gene_type:complete
MRQVSTTAVAAVHTANSSQAAMLPDICEMFKAQLGCTGTCAEEVFRGAETACGLTEVTGSYFERADAICMFMKGKNAEKAVTIFKATRVGGSSSGSSNTSSGSGGGVGGGGSGGGGGSSGSCGCGSASTSTSASGSPDPRKSKDGVLAAHTTTLPTAATVTTLAQPAAAHLQPVAEPSTTTTVAQPPPRQAVLYGGAEFTPGLFPQYLHHPFALHPHLMAFGTWAPQQQVPHPQQQASHPQQAAHLQQALAPAAAGRTAAATLRRLHRCGRRRRCHRRRCAS